MPGYKKPPSKIGDRFGRLIIINEAGRYGNHKKILVRCDCGTEKVVLLNGLRRGATTSCGCYHREVSRAKRFSTPERNRLKNVYLAMVSRCTKPHNKYYPSYGGRGISVCNEWLKSFDCFYQWGMNNGFDFGLSIDRINNDGNYNPDNCRWATRKVQQNNTRMNRYFEIDGKTLSLTQWSEIYKINPKTIDFRLRDGWNFKDAIQTPAMKTGTKRPKPLRQLSLTHKP